MTQKFIKHPDRSLVVDLSQIATVDKSNDKLGCHPYQLKFNTTGSEVFWWGFKTEEELDQVYDWVCSLVNPAVYGELKQPLECHSHGVDNCNIVMTGDSLFESLNDLDVKERNKLTIDITKEWRESTTDFNLTPYTGERMDIMLSGIKRTLNFYPQLEPELVMMVVDKLKFFTFESTFSVNNIGFWQNEITSRTMECLDKLLSDLGCITHESGEKPSENIYMKTNIPF